MSHEKLMNVVWSIRTCFIVAGIIAFIFATAYGMQPINVEDPGPEQDEFWPPDVVPHPHPPQPPEPNNWA